MLISCFHSVISWLCNNFESLLDWRLWTILLRYHCWTIGQ